METKIMRGAKSAATGSAIFWRGNNNDLQCRMGELRLSSAERGDYFDVIGKFTNIQNEYKVFNDMGHRVEADYRANGVSLSMDCGRRIAQPHGSTSTRALS